MTLTSDSCREDYEGTGGVSSYSFGFKIISDSDLRVIVRDLAGTEVTLTKNIHYTVSFSPNSSGGSITLLAPHAPLTADYKLTILRARPFTQTTDIKSQGNFYPRTYENALDAQAMLSQQLKEELSRVPKLPPTISDIDFDPTLPTDIFTPGATFGVNETGDGFAMGPTLPVLQEITDAADEAIAASAVAASHAADADESADDAAESEESAEASATAAEQSADEAEASAQQAITAAVTSTASAQAALDSQTAAAASATAAETAQDLAEEAADEAEASATSAASSAASISSVAAEAAQASAAATAADASADAAATSATAAATSATAAATSATQASGSNAGANAAETAANNAADTAGAYAASATTSATAAAASATAAGTHASNASQYSFNAQGHAGSASDAAVNAGNHSATAFSNAQEASEFADAASASATSAATSATAASGYSTAVTAAATAAADSADEAAASATAADAAKDTAEDAMADASASADDAAASATAAAASASTAGTHATTATTQAGTATTQAGLAATSATAAATSATAAATSAASVTPMNVVTKTSAYTAVSGDVILADATSAGFTITIPAASVNATIQVHKTDATFNVVTLSGGISTTLNTQGESVTLKSTATTWYVVERRIPSVWTNYTPVLTGFGTSALDGFWQREGGSIRLRARGVISSATATALSYTIPTGLTADSTKYPSGVIGGMYGTAALTDVSANNVYSGTSYMGSTTVVNFYGPNTSFWTNTVPVGIGVGDVLYMDILLPITGWKG